MGHVDRFETGYRHYETRMIHQQGRRARRRRRRRSSTGRGRGFRGRRGRLERLDRQLEGISPRFVSLRRAKRDVDPLTRASCLLDDRSKYLAEARSQMSLRCGDADRVHEFLDDAIDAQIVAATVVGRRRHERGGGGVKVDR